MFTRQKYLLGYLIASKGKCESFPLVKGMFLLCKEKLNRDIYDFHPYKYGPFSELLYVDLRALQKKGLIRQTKNTVTLTTTTEQNQSILKDLNQDFYQINLLADQINSLSFEEIINYVYQRHPYFAIRNPQKRDYYRKYDPSFDKTKEKAEIFTTGYEGLTIDAFINRLIQNNIQTLVDVRNNPRSMKYGFSENNLKKLCEDRKIEYLSIKNLGIKSENRQGLNTIEDYKKLFVEFEKSQIPKVKKEMEQLKNLLDRDKRISLMCFEKDVKYCHREVVARSLYSYCHKKYELTHL